MAILLPKAKVTPDGKPETDADIDPAQIGVAVYFTSVIAVVPVTVCELEPVVSATVNSLPQSGLLAVVRAELVAKSVGSDVMPETHQPVRS